MEIMRLSVQGKNLDSLIALLQRHLPDWHFCSPEGMHLFAGEKYYWRIGSNLMTVVVLAFSHSFVWLVALTWVGFMGLMWERVTTGFEGASSFFARQNAKDPTRVGRCMIRSTVDLIIIYPIQVLGVLLILFMWCIEGMLGSIVKLFERRSSY